MNKGKIYKLYNEYGTYYGSTTKSLKERLSTHKSEAKKNINKCSKSKILFQNGAIPKIELLEEIEFDDIYQLREREAYYIRNLECINKAIPNRTNKEYKKDNKNRDKEKIAKNLKEYREKNKDIIAQMKKKWNEKNKEYVKQRNKKYREINKEVIAEKVKIKINCECGATVTKSNIQRHKKSKKHLKFIEEINSTIII